MTSPTTDTWRGGHREHRIVEGLAQGMRTVTLSSHAGNLDATFAPKVGMVGSSLRHAGTELLALQQGLEHYAAAGGTMGIPLLYPWANRLEGFRYSACGHEVVLDASSPLVQTDPNGLPIHGLLAGCPHWEVEKADANRDAARLVAHLDFSAQPQLLEAFPFEHDLWLEVLLSDNELTLTTTVAPKAGQVPVSFGFHPYLRLPGSDRRSWIIDLPVRRHVCLDQKMLPTDQTEAVEPVHAELADRCYDDCFDRLVEPAVFSVSDTHRRISVRLGEGFSLGQVYSPPGAQFICFEPMTAPTNALVNGRGLQVATADQPYRATFSITVAEAAG